MKKFSLILALILPMLFTSCGFFSQVDMGYPKEVIFVADGGEQIIYGEMSFNTAETHNYKNGDQGDISSGEGEEDGMIINEYQWLKVEYKERGTGELKIYAEPNTTGKSRELHIELISGYDYHVVKVVQEK